MVSTSQPVSVTAPIGDDQHRRIANMNANALIVRLHFTVNHLSRWLSPIHDANRLERALYRDQPTVKDLVIGMRDEEERVYPKMYLIATQMRADLDTLPPWRPNPARTRDDERDPPIVLMAHFRRLRQSTCSLLRSLPDDAWHLKGVSRREQNASVRELAEGLAVHDYQYLRTIDGVLDQVGARENLAEIQKTHLDALLELSPDQLTL